MTKGERTRQRIIEVSAPVFNRYGFETTSMSQLMEVTGLEKGGLYRHFSSKEEIALEVFKYSEEKIYGPVFAALEKIEDPVDRLHAFVKGFAKKLPIAGGCPIFNTAVEHDHSNSKLREVAAAAFSLRIKRLAKWFIEAQREKRIALEMPATEAALHLFCSLEGALIARDLMGTEHPLRSTERMLISFLEGLET
ncbi:MAG TPA: TetR/AcrR family transcriptional regulator [Bdellovibrionales bacterium]|nr:TetR/AcrR family transcriptional regulator [Bdellovibrionales bacterium]